MVWKPVVAEAALDLLSTMCLDCDGISLADMCSGSDRLNSLDWLFLEDPERKRLLVELEVGFQVLLSKQEQASFSWISDRYFTIITSLASNLISVGHPPRYNLYFLQCLLAHSPASFCLLEATHLSQFVELVCQLVKQATLPTPNRESIEGDVKCSNSEDLDATSFSLDGHLAVNL